jgi:hypothetical protein
MSLNQTGANANAAATGNASTAGTATGNAGSATDATGMGMETDPADTESTTGLLEPGAPAAVPGVRGGIDWLDIDVSHLPRREEFDAVIAMGTETFLALPPSDIKTVSYYLKPPDPLADEDEKGMTQGGFTDEAKRGGLARRVIDRAVARTAYLMNDTTLLEDADDVIAPEITTLQFRYFDGAMWVEEWDTETYGGLPVAVEVTLGITPMRFLQMDEDDVPFGGTTDELYQGEVYYRMCVRLPAARPLPPPEEELATETGTETATPEETAP